MEKRFIQGTDQMYEIYENGDVYSYHSNKFLKPFIDKDGYLRVTITYNKRYRKKFIHRLVAQAFIENPEEYSIINHIDGDKKNNWPENLEWCTHSHNTKHAYRTGLKKNTKGSESVLSKINKRDLPKLREDIKNGMSYEDISEKYQISTTLISMIKNGKRYGETIDVVEDKSRKGSANAQSKLVDDDVKEIFELLKQKKPQTQIAKLYGVDKSLISSIARRKSWTHIETDYVYEHVTNKIDLSVYPKVIECFETSGLTRKQVAEKFGISKSMVEKILRTRNS